DRWRVCANPFGVARAGRDRRVGDRAESGILHCWTQEYECRARLGDWIFDARCGAGVVANCGTRVASCAKDLWTESRGGRRFGAGESATIGQRSRAIGVRRFVCSGQRVVVCGGRGGEPSFERSRGIGDDQRGELYGGGGGAGSAGGGASVRRKPG